MEIDFFHEIKQEVFQAVTVLVLLYSSITWTLMKYLEKNLNGNYYCFEENLQAAPLQNRCCWAT